MKSNPGAERQILHIDHTTNTVTRGTLGQEPERFLTRRSSAPFRFKVMGLRYCYYCRVS